MTQVEAAEAEADMHVGALEALAVIAVFLLAEGHVNLVHLAAVKDDGLGLAGVMTMAGAALLAEEQQGEAPYHSGEAYHILPDVGPEDDIAGRQEQQDADAEAYDGARLVAVVEDIDEAGDDDEDGPPAFEADVDQVEEFEGPDDAEGQKGDAADDFASVIHYSIIIVLFYK